MVISFSIMFRIKFVKRPSGPRVVMVSRMISMSLRVIALVRMIAVRKIRRNTIAPTTSAIKLLKASRVMRT